MTNLAGDNYELRCSAEQLQKDESPALQILVTADGRPIAMNLTGRRFVGAPAIAEWSDVMSSPDRNRWDELLQTALKHQVPASGSFRLRRFDKAFRTFILRAEQRYSNAGIFLGLVVSGMDISELSGPEIAPAEAAASTSLPQGNWNQEALRWHDELVSVATIVAGCADVLGTLLQDSRRDDVREVLARLQSATGILRSTVAELSSTGRMDAAERQPTV